MCTAGLAIFKNPPNLEGAKALWIKHSVEGQEVIRERDLRAKIRPEVEIPKEIKDFNLTT